MHRSLLIESTFLSTSGMSILIELEAALRSPIMVRTMVFVPQLLVAPFWVDYYIQHRKGGVGLMAVQHDKNRVLEESDKKNKKKMKTSDDRMLLPGRAQGKSYFDANPDSTDVRTKWPSRRARTARWSTPRARRRRCSRRRRSGTELAQRGRPRDERDHVFRPGGLRTSSRRPRLHLAGPHVCARGKLRMSACFEVELWCGISVRGYFCGSMLQRFRI